MLDTVTLIYRAATRHGRPTDRTPGMPRNKVVKLLEGLVADEPQASGRFYQIQPDDTPLGVALAALGERATTKDAIEYLRCISSGPRWNMPLYATPSTSKSYPATMLVPGARIGVRVAFLPRNHDALDCLLQGRMPTMAVDPRKGSPASSSTAYGLLWLPPVDERFSCAAFEWAGGCSVLDPPPDLLKLLR